MSRQPSASAVVGLSEWARGRDVRNVKVSKTSVVKRCGLDFTVREDNLGWERKAGGGKSHRGQNSHASNNLVHYQFFPCLEHAGCVDFDFMTSVTMPNPRLCRIEVLKHPGNCVNPADPPSCHSAPCGIVRCASQESQRSPSGRLTSSLSFVERHRRAGQSASVRLVSRPVQNITPTHALSEAHSGRFRISLDEGICAMDCVSKIKPMSTVSYMANCDLSISNLWRFAIK